MPQNRTLNRGPWRQLEADIRKLRPTRVLTGAVYDNCGNERIEAPCLLYKIALLPDGQIFTHVAKSADPRP